MFYLFFVFLFLNFEAYSLDCVPLLDNNCSSFASCLNNRIKFQCDDGRIGYFSDDLVPDSIFNSSGHVKNNTAIRSSLQKESFGYSVFSFPDSAQFFEKDSGSAVAIKSTKFSSLVSCNWINKPSPIVGKCTASKPICNGNVICKHNDTGASFSASVFCLEIEAGYNCYSASLCASAISDIRAASCRVPGEDENGKPVLPNRSDIPKSTIPKVSQ